MLVLSRQSQESIMIGDTIEVTIVGIRGGNVKLGITAPRHVPVHRRQVYDRIHAEGLGNGQTKGDRSDAAQEHAVPNESVQI